MANQQPARPFFRLGSIRPVQTTPQRAPPPIPAPQPAIVGPAVPRFRTPAAQTTPPRETGPPAPPRQIGTPAAPAPPPTTVIRSTIVQPQPPSSTFSPTPIPETTPSSPLLRPPPTQPNLVNSKPASPQPRFITSSIPSSPTTKTEPFMRSSPQQSAPAPKTVSSPRFLTDKSPAFQPQTLPSATSASQNSFTRKPYPEPSTTPTATSPVRKASTPSPNSKTITTSRSPPPPPSPTNGSTLRKTPPQSPLARPLTHPTSPLTLPPPQINTETNHQPNTVPTHESIFIARKRNENPTNKHVDQAERGNDKIKKIVEDEQHGMRMIRLAGQNHGAIMDLSPSFSNENRNGMKSSMEIQEPQMRAFMNSNVQGMNNCIVYNTSFNHNDPGVHFSFSKSPNGGFSRTT